MSIEVTKASSGDVGCAVSIIVLIIAIFGSWCWLSHDEQLTERPCIAAGGEMVNGHCDASGHMKSGAVK